jgi:hypothetical protein
MPYDSTGRKKKKRVMRKFQISEISAVDRPAQSPATAVIMKRASIEKGGDMVDTLTSVEEGHQHGLSVRQDDGELFVWLHYAQAEGAESGHDHQVVMDASGNLTVSENQGHTHSIDAEEVRNALFNRLTNKRETETELPEINNIMDLSNALETFKNAGDKDMSVIAAHVVKRAEALGMTELLPVEGEIASIFKNAADNGGGQQTGDNDMSKADNAANDTAVKELEAKLAKAEALATLTDVQKSHYSELDEAGQEAFLAKSSTERDAEVEIAKSADAVVYKSLDGEEFRKSDDPRLVAMAKRADAQMKALEKAEQREAETALRKRAEEELSSLPGDVDTHVAILKAVDSIENEDVRKAAMEVLKSKNEVASSAYTTRGTTVISKAASGDAHAELDRLAKAYQKEHDVDFYTAYDAVTKLHQDLYTKAVNG